MSEPDADLKRKLAEARAEMDRCARVLEASREAMGAALRRYHALLVDSETPTGNPSGLTEH